MASLLVITGAGISAASGIPTYRGAGKNFPIMSFHDTSAKERWHFADECRKVIVNAEPNEAHRLLLELEKKFDRFLIATQNVDGLHQAAGSTCVTELHGNIWQIARPRTVADTEDEQFSEDSMLVHRPEFRDEILEQWSRENHHEVWEDREVPFRSIPPYPDPDVRPNVLFMDELYGNRLLWVEDFIRRGVDQILIIGCSGSVDIVSRLTSKAREHNSHLQVTSINPAEQKFAGVDRHIRKDAIQGLRLLL